MQHHGAQTRLIDFTRDINIALYFACQPDNKEELAIYAVDLCKIRRIEEALNFYREEYYYDEQKWTDSMLFYLNRKLEVNYFEFSEKDKIPSKRIKRQKGLFLFSADLRFNFYENFSRTHGKNIRKYILKADKFIREDILMKLSRDHGINKEYLLPGENFNSSFLKCVGENIIQTMINDFNESRIPDENWKDHIDEGEDLVQ